jgi:hypothetical protein
MTGELRTRRLRDVLEPVAGCVYFAPETHRAFEELGFGPPNPGFRGVEAPNQDAYFTSRGGCMGRVTGEAVAAAFGVFSPDVVVPSVERGWAIADRDDILSARERGTVAFLERVVVSAPAEVARATELLLRGAAGAGLAGRPLYAGLRSLGLPGNPAGDLWRAADLVREHRGDCHIAAWTGAGLSAPEIMLLTELWWGMPRRSYALTRGWSADEYDRADADLAAAGLVTATGPEGALTAEGRALRRRIESATDLMEARVLAAIGTDIDELIALLEPMTEAVVAAGGYPAGAFQTASDL